MDVERLLADEEAAWQDLHGLFHSVPDGRFEEPGVTPEGWSPKDVMFHVGAWLAECGARLEQIRMGTFDENDELTDQATDQKNAEWFEISRTLDISSVRAELHAARARMMKEWSELPQITPEAWSWFEEAGPIHYRVHGQALSRWLGGNGA